MKRRLTFFVISFLSACLLFAEPFKTTLIKKNVVMPDNRTLPELLFFSDAKNIQSYGTYMFEGKVKGCHSISKKVKYLDNVGDYAISYKTYDDELVANIRSLMIDSNSSYAAGFLEFEEGYIRYLFNYKSKKDKLDFTRTVFYDEDSKTYKRYQKEREDIVDILKD